MKQIRKHKTKIALLLSLTFLFQVFIPLNLFAITGQNSMPEYRSFEPVATTNMVNLSDGSFTYNIPLIDVPNGYPINLSYHSNDNSPDAMASWVGAGWNINPGAINRIKRGFPDEYKDKTVKYFTRMPANWTISGEIGVGLEILGSEDLIQLNLGARLTYNNYNGIATRLSAGFGFCGVLSLDFTYAQGRFGFSPEINPAGLFSVGTKIKNAKEKHNNEKKNPDLEGDYHKLLFGDQKARNQVGKEMKDLRKGKTDQVSFSYGGLSAGVSGGKFFSGIGPSMPQSFPTTSTNYGGFMITIRFDIGVNIWPFPLDPEGKAKGTFARQEQTSSNERSVFGYMHSGEAFKDKDNVMDYFSENEKPFEKRDRIIGIPFPNNDVYLMTGEGMGGSFRPFRSEYGHYRPNFSGKSEDIHVNLGADLNLAAVFCPIPLCLTNLVYTLGLEIGGAYHWEQSGDWDFGLSDDHKFNEDNIITPPESDGNEDWFFRFSHDLGGDVYYNNYTDDATYAGDLNVSAFSSDIDLAAAPSGYLDQGRNNKKRSSYIAHTTQYDANLSVGTHRYKRYEKDLHILNGNSGPLQSDYYPINTADRYLYNPANSDQIVEVATINEDGAQYVYGLPVKCKNERQLSYSLRQDQRSSPAGSRVDVTGTNIDSDAKRKVGYDDHNNDYVSTYLITQITSPDYVDRQMNGPTDDDFGSYTRFGYERYTGEHDWYKYRNPYNGLSFSYGSLSEKNDDMGSYSYGEKEMYYLRSVASKTHVAIFVLSQREDGKDAMVNHSPGDDELIKGTTSGANDVVKPLKLDKIDLYALKDVELIPSSAPGSPKSGIYRALNNAIPIKTVHFKYDYELCPGTPNSSTGKLTLKKVWFEYEGKKVAKISPYEFTYSYPTGNIYPAPYSSDADFTKYLTTTADQNPQYSPANIDRWGAYQKYSDKTGSLTGDFANFFPFVNQDYDDPIQSSAFDPAAYMLKQIKLPSGGEIHVQYEQSDYQYVQDKRAMIMVPLTAGTGTDAENQSKSYYLDLLKVGITWPASASEQKKIADQLFEPMNLNKERLYFNFLFNLVGGEPSLGINQSCEYIEGFARIDGYGYDNTGPYFKFKGGGSGTYQSISYPGGLVKREKPKEAAKDFYNKMRRGKVNGSSTGIDDLGDTGASGEDILWAFIDLLGSIFNSCCDYFKPEYSYVRVQMPISYKDGSSVYDIHSKFGGGVRVKRLLMYDPNDGGSNADKALYGQGFGYKTEYNGVEISSGVTTNEPLEGRRESPLVQPIEKEEQSKFEALLYGRDMYSQEGPLGESLLPAPSITYSKVTVSSIHKGATSTGSEVHEFYTCKDYPSVVEDHTMLQSGNETSLGGGASVGFVSGSYTRETPHLAQGFRFRLYEMHGKPKRISKYSAGDLPNLMARETYEYFSPGETVQVMDENMAVGSGNIDQFGKETEMLSERRWVEDVSIGGEIGFDLSWGFFIIMFGWFPIPVPYALPSTVHVGFDASEKSLHTHATTKIVSYPAILKRITNMADGVTNVTENLVLDKMTGKPVVVKSYDDFTGQYLNHDFLAGYSHKNMRPKAINQNMIAVGLDYHYVDPTHGFLNFSTLDCDEMAKFIKGDLLKITSGSTYLYHIEDVDLIHMRVNLLKSGMSGALTVNSTVDALVVRSGYTNQLNAKQGNILLHGENLTPINPTVSSQIQNFIQTLNNVLSQLTAALPATPSITINYDPNDKTMCIYGTAICGGSGPLVPITMQLDPTGCFGGYPSVIFTSPCRLADQSVFGSGQWQTCSTLPMGQTFSTETEFMFVPGCGCLGLKANHCAAPYYHEGKIIMFCDDVIKSEVHDVVTASATKYSDVWNYDQSLYSATTPFNGDEFEKAIQGKWRVGEQYIYRENLNTVAGTTYKNFNSGKFTMHLFNYDGGPAGPLPDYNWVLTNKVNKYAPNGEPIEDENVLKIKSTAKYGYNSTVPVLVAQNAADHSVAYESFENVYNYSSADHFEDNLLFPASSGTWITNNSHTGKSCVQLNNATDFNIANWTLSPFPVNGQEIKVRGWFCKGINATLENLVTVKDVTGSPSAIMKRIASSGVWELYEGTFQVPSGSSHLIVVNVAAPNVLMDDIRVQTKESEMVCYVYDKAKRLVAVFDDQHFATIYQYNAEGLLVRKLKETTQGIKTISSTQYNSKGVAAPIN